MSEVDVPDDIQRVLFIKREIEALILEVHNEQLKIALREIDRYLILHCPHQFVNDLIDVDPDKSITIHYCQLCFMDEKQVLGSNCHQFG
jgi:hypothetical protein